MSTLKPYSFPKKILKAALSSTGDRIILPDIKGWDGNNLTAAELGSVHYAVLQDFTQSKLEIMEIDPSTLTVATTTGILITKRACGFNGGTSAGAETAVVWTPNESWVLLGSNPPQQYADLVDLNEAQTITAVKTFTASPVVPTPSGNTDAANKAYVDGVVTGGAADSNETTKGLVESATSAEVAAGDDTGTTTAPTVVRPSKLAEVIQKGSYVYAASTTGSDTYTAVLTPTLTAYTTGMSLLIKFTTANTTAATLNIDALGAKDIKKYVAGAIAALETGDIVAAQICQFAYDGTQFILLNPGATTMTTALATEASTFFSNTDITGAEAETLSAGAEITTLHFHKKTFGTAAVSNGSTTQTIAHALGATPKQVSMRAFQAYATGAMNISDGIWSAAGTGSIYINNTDVDATSGALVVIKTDAGAALTASVTADGTNITLTWSSTAATTASLIWEAEV